MYTTTEVLGQVEKICANLDLKTKPQICRFLRYVVTETLEGRSEQLKGYTIGTCVFGKDKDFDPEQDSLVRIHAGRLRRLLKVYYLDSGKDDPIYIEIPKGRYKAIFSIMGDKKVSENAENYSKDYPPREASVAVLPFKNLTGNPDKDYFAYGFSEELSTELTKYEDIKIINCWNRPEIHVVDLHSWFGARFIIDGNIQTNDHEIRILVKLLDAATGEQIWAERFKCDLNLKKLIHIQEDISENVAKTVGSEVGIVFTQLAVESRRTRPENLEVFDAILQFYYYEAHMSASLGALTFTKLHQALTKDPSSGVVHAMLANMYGTAYALDYPDRDGYLEKTIELIDLALQLDPDNFIVRIVNCIRFFMLDEKDRFLNEVNHCLSMNIISPMKLGALGFYLLLYGYWDRGKAILDKVMNKNIGYPKYLHGPTCLYYFQQKNYTQAIKEAVKYEMPGVFWGPMLRACCLGQLGEKTKAKVQIEELLLLKPDFEEKAEYLISRFVKEKSLVNQVLGGLKDAGLKF